jgi:hypothetical protein
MRGSSAGKQLNSPPRSGPSAGANLAQRGGAVLTTAPFRARAAAGSCVCAAKRNRRHIERARRKRQQKGDRLNEFNGGMIFARPIGQ